MERSWGCHAASLVTSYSLERTGFLALPSAQPQSKETSMTEPLVVRRETQIAAPPATVFAFLTDPEKILSWMGAEATTEPHPGGLYLVKGIAARRRGARSVPRGRAGPPPRLQLRLGGQAKRCRRDRA